MAGACHGRTRPPEYKGSKAWNRSSSTRTVATAWMWGYRRRCERGLVRIGHQQWCIPVRLRLSTKYGFRECGNIFFVLTRIRPCCPISLFLCPLLAMSLPQRGSGLSQRPDDRSRPTAERQHSLLCRYGARDQRLHRHNERQVITVGYNHLHAYKLSIV